MLQRPSRQGMEDDFYPSAAMGMNIKDLQDALYNEHGLPVAILKVQGSSRLRITFASVSGWAKWARARCPGA